MCRYFPQIPATCCCGFLCVCPDVLEQSLKVHWEGDFGARERFGFPIGISPTLGKASPACGPGWPHVHRCPPPVWPPAPSCGNPPALALGTCAGSGDPALWALDDFRRKREGGNHFAETLAPTRAGVGGQVQQEETGTGSWWGWWQQEKK